MVPAKNIIKIYLENGHYHLYNRGVDKRDIFLDEQDYKVFLHFLKRYLTKPPDSPDKIRPGWKIDLFDKVNLLAYCLMSNHFHFLIQQVTKSAIADFMQALNNSYVRYFNKKYERVGPLFQGTYKGVLIDNDIYLLHLTRYIHLNSLEVPGEVTPGTTGTTSTRNSLLSYPYSSYCEYLGQRKTDWIHPEGILAFFKNNQEGNLKNPLSYQSFVENFKEDPRFLLDQISID